MTPRPTNPGLSCMRQDKVWTIHLTCTREAIGQAIGRPTRGRKPIWVPRGRCAEFELGNAMLPNVSWFGRCQWRMGVLRRDKEFCCAGEKWFAGG